MASKIQTVKQYTVGGLFSGVGGIELGFQQAGFQILWANEIDKNSCITYRKNFNHQLFEGDTNNLDGKNYMNRVFLLHV